MGKFYTVSQNNSGGYFIRNDDVREMVSVEANSPQEAEEIMEDITSNYSQYCSCCGERWWISFDESDGKDVPCMYGEPITTEYCTNTSFDKSVVVYYLNGDRKYIEADGYSK